MENSSSPSSSSEERELSTAERLRAQRPWEKKERPPRLKWKMLIPGVAVLLVALVSGGAYLAMQGSLPLPVNLLPGKAPEEVPEVPTTPPVSLPVCGDSVQAEGEQCDDGNATDGDGCSATCKPEAGWVCSTLPCKRISVCGDGFITGTESCDDSNVEAGDGCSATCALEYKAPTQRAAESTPAEDQVSSEGEESEEPSL